MRITLIGGNGQLGTDLRRRLGGEVISLDVPAIDVCDEGSVESALAGTRPEIVINCAAMTDVDGCEDEVAAAFHINAQGALHVAKQAERHGAAVVFISTDYVFGAEGRRKSPYRESDVPGPVNVYGASKLAGEHLTQSYCQRHLVVRTCGLYGLAGARGKGGNFVESILRRAQEGGPLRVVCDQRLTPTSTWALAGKIAGLIDAGATGLYHVAALNSCTWHEFAEAIVGMAGMDVRVEAIPTSAYPCRARRPEMSALMSERLGESEVGPCETWRELLQEYLASRGEGAPGAPK